MLSFENDYNTGAHPKILEKLIATNMEQCSGYGSDPYSERAKEKIREACGCPDAEIYFLTGGTQTNSVIISTMLEDFEGVIAAETGHVSVHEAGAIEFSGHKVLTLKSHDGKIDPAELKTYLEIFYGDANHEHMVFPGMVYLSFPTEYGTIYTREELNEISEICHTYDLILYVDGARLGYGLMSSSCDISLKELTRLVDVFYIGGTKVGALCGEAVVFCGKKRPRHFVTKIKQRGALLAKGRLNGIQFDTLFTDDLYFQISRHAIDMAEQMIALFRKYDYTFFMNSPTNQQFLVLENTKMEELKNKVVFSFWEKVDENHTAVRFATSWSTTPEDLAALEEILKEN